MIIGAIPAPQCGCTRDQHEHSCEWWPLRVTTGGGVHKMTFTAVDLADILDGRLMQVADGTWSAAQFIDFTASLVTQIRRETEDASLVVDSTTERG